MELGTSIHGQSTTKAVAWNDRKTCQDMSGIQVRYLPNVRQINYHCANLLGQMRQYHTRDDHEATHGNNKISKTVYRSFMNTSLLTVQWQKHRTKQVLSPWQLYALTEVKRNIHKAGEVCKLVHKVKQLADIIGDRWCVWVLSFQMFFIDLAHTCNENIIKVESFHMKTPRACSCIFFYSGDPFHVLVQHKWTLYTKLESCTFYPYWVRGHWQI